jgi:hypothetical protein
MEGDGAVSKRSLLCCLGDRSGVEQLLGWVRPLQARRDEKEEVAWVMGWRDAVVAVSGNLRDDETHA